MHCCGSVHKGWRIKVASLINWSTIKNVKNLKRNEKKLQVERSNNNNKLRICSRGPTRRFFFHFLYVFVFVAVSVAQFRFGRFDVAPLTTHSNRHPLFIDPLCGCIGEEREEREKKTLRFHCISSCCRCCCLFSRTRSLTALQRCLRRRRYISSAAVAAAALVGFGFGFLCC